ncbi:branched-chain amino acid ABC transporter2C amino acid-binding protein [Corallococcus coralloides]|uniref:Branched-chain amino acid ABC transporter2C amino acid-binding protein n=1 Tax=Corallococcus coralloides TaxID=184914 RepID=A0A410RSS5_CORCK|nr:kelch motif-containing protein [Corallococcus coralloides]QAT84912.1 branched-chain amino acid ABC transporter2C amino acid-binding protein [Corallococcus coralloides]
MKRASFSLVLVLALGLALIAGCSATSSDTGSARFAVSVPQALSSDISRVSVTSSGPDIPSVTVDLVQTEGVWGGTIGNIPAGPDRSFLAQAFDASGTLLFSGSASGVSILADQMTFVAITLQELNPPPPFDNEAPLIDSLVVSSTSVPLGRQIRLSARAHDPNPGDTLSYAWSATAGSFSSPSSASTSWTAPLSPGMQQLSLSVTDSRGLASNLLLVVNVTEDGSEGDAALLISINSSPRVDSLIAVPTQLAVGQQTSVSVSASDPDGDSLSYSWSATCAGTWINAHSSSPLFTPTALPEGACNNCRLTVSISDGRGGQNTGTVALCVGHRPPVPHLAPVIVRSYRSSDTATGGQVLTYEVVASDPEGSALSFSWAATAGVLDAATGDASRSRVTWTAPLCVRASTTPTITATVTNAFGLRTTRSFPVAGLPDCSTAGAWVLTGSMSTPRLLPTATLLPNGRVLVAGGAIDIPPLIRNLAPLETAEIFNPTSGTWSATGSMAAPRFNHTATLLPNGKVLVAGGDGGNYPPLVTAELYDPTSGTWSATGSMTAPRMGHTATLLPNGKVLVIGGFDTSVGDFAEVYDPSSGTWATTGPMTSPRNHGHTATLLPNGKVLVTGGYDVVSGPLATAEWYDPTSDTWSPVGSMLSTRYEHTATLLPDGKILVAGGYTPIPTSAELYDPGSDTWSETGSLLLPAYLPTATLLLTGQVLVVGASREVTEVYDPASGTWSLTEPMAEEHGGHTATLLPDGRVLVAGDRTATAEVFGPPSGTWSPISAMLEPRLGQSVNLLPDGQVLVAGGVSPSGVPLATAEVYDPTWNTWHATGSMAAARVGVGHAATPLLDGKVLVWGGGTISAPLLTAELYDPTSGTWSAAHALPERLDLVALLPSGQVLAESNSAMWFYDPASDTWSASPTPPPPHFRPATLLANGEVLFGGNPAWWLYDPTSDTWSATGTPSGTARYGIGISTLLANGKVLNAGGYDFVADQVTGAAQLYDPASGTWSLTDSMSPRTGNSATLLLNGKVLVAGGVIYPFPPDPPSIPLSSAQLYDPASGTWSATGSMSEPRSGPQARRLLDGRVLVMGGFEGPGEVYTP